ncbi:MAG: class I adenylate-forming enzyme family protein [Pikeienuella sp.]
MRTVSLFDEGPPPPCPTRFNLAQYVLAEGVGTKVALTVVQGAGDPAPLRLTFDDLRDQVLRAGAGLLAAGAMRGDRIVLRVGHSVDFPILFLGATAVGLTPIPTSPLLSPAEVAHIAQETAATLIIASPEIRVPAALTPEAVMGGEDLADFADTGADDLAYIIYTSGSSGKPKGVAHAHRAVWARRMMWDGWYGLTPEDVVLHAGAFNWTYTLGAGLMDPWACGASTLIYAGPRDPGVWYALIREHNASIFAAAPGVYRQLLKSNSASDGLVSLRHGISAGETLAAPTRAAWVSATGTPVYEALGMTELSTYLSSAPDHPPKEGRAGRPQPGRRLALLQDGEPVAIGEVGQIALAHDDPGLMKEYWNDPEATASVFDGEWFLTGDMGRMDQDGYVAFLGRNDDQMNALGYRVAPEEVEAALCEHPAIAAAAAVELPVRADLSVIAAFVVPEDNADPTMLREAALKDHCQFHLAAYKIPKIFQVVETLPRNPNGKLKRRELIARYGWKSEA